MSPASPNNPSEPRKERRRHLRIKAAVEVELQLQKQATPFRVKTSDLSLGGCYVEMMFTLEVGTKARLTLSLNDAKVSTDGIVVSRDLQVGNGIQFVGMSAEDSVRLKQFLAATP
jgi:c-di-GMP-binding flagellar brake protein YcgR